MPESQGKASCLSNLRGCKSLSEEVQISFRGGCKSLSEEGANLFQRRVQIRGGCKSLSDSGYKFSFRLLI